MQFDDKVIIVTGGASGMGRATATKLGSSGANVVIADIDAEAAGRVVDSIGENATLVETDLRSLDSIRSLVAETEERFGRIDGLANVAAVYPAASFIDTTPEMWQLIDDINHRASFFAAQTVARSMIDNGNGGAIVNVASGAAFRPVPGMAAYTGSKGAVVALTRIMAHELAPHGIRVNTMAPGHTDTEGNRRSLDDEQFAAMAKTLVAGRWMQPEEIAEAISFLLSDDSRGMTGACINVNLGNYMPH